MKLPVLIAYFESFFINTTLLFPSTTAFMSIPPISLRNLVLDRRSETTDREDMMYYQVYHDIQPPGSKSEKEDPFLRKVHV